MVHKTERTPRLQRMTDMSVERLVRAAQAGDNRAWNEIVRRYGGLVWAVTRAHRLSDADAADAAQATWIRLVRRLRDLQDPAALPGWLATTARRECLRTLRVSGRQVSWDEFPDVMADEPEPGSALVAHERALAVQAAFARLGEGDQALLRLLAADPAPGYVEISAALAMPIGSIGPTRARALARLRREIGRSGALPLVGA
jgi:RNA polymerase sigma factor (sigma-70 family)